MGKISRRERWHIPNYYDPKEVRYGVVSIQSDKCTDCGLCEKYCPGNALVVEEKLARMRPANEGLCSFCGACMAICPKGAIIMVSGNEYEGYFKTIDRGEPAPPRLCKNW